jgi:hypothetical protein
VLTARTGFVLASFGKAVLWAALVYGALLLLVPAPAAGFTPYQSRLLLLAGAFLFGVGAAINGGCSMSTLQRLADGDLRMLAALLAFCAGALTWSLMYPALHVARSAREPLAWETFGNSAYLLLLLLALWGIRELRRLWRTRPRGIAWWRLPLAEAYRLSTAAAVLGMIGGLLYGVKGAWSYTYYLRTQIDSAYHGNAGPPLLHAALFAALFAGMLASALQRRSWQFRGASLRALLPHAGGGWLMGIGAAMVPGGNDTLMLVGLPTLSLWALAAYAALLAGIAAALMLMRSAGLPLQPVQCPNDVCQEPQHDATALPPC